MTTFKDRNKGFERKFAHDEELKFRATARRNKLLGLWAAEKLGLEGDERERLRARRVRLEAGGAPRVALECRGVVRGGVAQVCDAIQASSAGPLSKLEMSA